MQTSAPGEAQAGGSGPPARPSPEARVAAALERVDDTATRRRIAFIVEEVVAAVLASAPRGKRELQLRVLALGGKVDRDDVTVGFQKHPPE